MRITLASAPNTIRSIEADSWSVVPALVVSLVAASVYVSTAARDIVVGDNPEFLSVALTLGVAHPPGFPLLTLLGHMFSWLPVGSLPFRVNLAAVACHSATVGMVFLIARRLHATHVASAIAALALAFQPLFWEWSLVFESFPLNDFLATMVLYFLVRWEGQPDRARYLIVAAFLGGLGAANHLTIVFLVPAAVVVLWRQRRHVQTRPWLLGACAAAGVAGLFPYAYIPWAASRHPYLNWGGISSFSGLLNHFLRTDYGTGNLVMAGGSPGSPLQRLSGLGASFTVPEAVLLAFGAWVAYRRVRWYFWSSLVVFGLAGPWFAAIANIDVGDPAVLWVLRRFFLLPHVTLAPLMALGIDGLSDLVGAHATPRNQRLGTIGVAVGLAAVIGAGILRDYRRIDQHRNHLARHFGEDILGSLDPGSVLVGLGDEVVFPVAYLQSVERQRPDVTLVILGLLRTFPWYAPQLRERDPGLRVPFDRYDPPPLTSLGALVTANPGRRFAVVGATTLDEGLRGSYWFYHRGLVSQLEPQSRHIDVATAAAETDRLLRMYRIPDAETIKTKSFEIGVLARYAQPALIIGYEYARQHDNAQAESWYQRAREIAPSLVQSRAASAK